MAKGLSGIVLSERIFLDKWDPDKDTFVVFQRPSRWEMEELDKVYAQVELEFDDEKQGTMIQRNRVPFSVLESKQVSMALVESNIPDEEGNPLFVPGKTCRAARKNMGQRAEEGFYRVWYRADFPPELAQEIVEKLHEWHPPFDWRNPAEGND